MTPPPEVRDLTGVSDTSRTQASGVAEKVCFMFDALVARQPSRAGLGLENPRMHEGPGLCHATRSVPLNKLA